MNKRRSTVYIYAVLAMCFWALSFVWIKEVYEYYKPLTAITLRLTAASLILWSVSRIVRLPVTIRREDYGLFALLAFTEPFCYFLGESFGMQYVSSTVGAIIISTIPLFSPFLARMFFNEQLSVLNLIGLFVSFSGIALMVFNPAFAFGQSPDAPLVGILLMFFAVLSALAYGLLIKRLSDRYNPFTIIVWQNSLGVFYFLPLFFFFDFAHFQTVTPTPDLIAALLQLTIFASIIAFILYIPVIKEIGVTKANVFANMIPVFTGIFSYIILDERFTALKIAGMVLVVCGLFLSQKNTIQKG